MGFMGFRVQVLGWGGGDEEVDLASLTGLPSCSAVVIVELEPPAAKQRQWQLRQQRRRSPSHPLGPEGVLRAAYKISGRISKDLQIEDPVSKGHPVS